MRVLQVGAYPPPIGGTSVHIQRLHRFLIQCGVESHVLDYWGGDKPQQDGVLSLPRSVMARLVFLLRLALVTNADTIIHFQISTMGSFRWAAPLLLLIFSRQPKVISFRSGQFPGAINSRWGRRYLCFLMRFFVRIITVSNELRDFLKLLGIPAHKISVIPGFIPQKPDPTRLPAIVAEWQGRKTLVLAAGFLTEIYNFDLLLDCIPHLDTDRYQFIFAFYGHTDPAYEKHIDGRIDGIENLIVLRQEPPDVFTSVLDACDIFVRPTTLDGDSVSVREALAYGKTVFASDCVARPKGCQLFPTNDVEALLALFHVEAQAVVATVQLAPAVQNSDESFHDLTINARRVLALYEEVLSIGGVS